MTARTERLRRASLDATPSISSERALITTAFGFISRMFLLPTWAKEFGLKVVATTEDLASLVREVGGDRLGDFLVLQVAALVDLHGHVHAVGIAGLGQELLRARGIVGVGLHRFVVAEGVARQRHCDALAEAGELKPTLSRVLPLEEAADAHRLLDDPLAVLENRPKLMRKLMELGDRAAVELRPLDEVHRELSLLRRLTFGAPTLRDAVALAA